jgi:hypothetical protein
VPLTECARLLDADAGRDLLAGHPEADLVLLLTDPFYRDVAGSGTSLGPDAFQRISLSAGDTDRTAWAYLPGCVPAAAASSPSPSRPPMPEAQAHSGVWIAGDRHVFNGPIVGGDYHG